MQIKETRTSWPAARLFRYGWAMLLMVGLAGCHFDMYNQPKDQTYDPSTFFADGRGSRPNVAGAVVHNGAQTDTFLSTGLVDGLEVDMMPFEVTRPLLERGQAQFNIYCAPCHGEAGTGQSAVAELGAIVPANLHQQRLIDAPLSHFFVIPTTGVYRGDPDNGGYLSMFSYASRISVEDRWAIAAYIRALQLSQNATIDDVPLTDRESLGR